MALRNAVFLQDRDTRPARTGWRTEFAPAMRVAWTANEAYMTVRRDIAHRPEGDRGGAGKVAKRPAWAGLSEIKKTSKIGTHSGIIPFPEWASAYFAQKQITGEKVGLDQGFICGSPPSWVFLLTAELSAQ